MEKRKKLNEKGITLIALIVTIIVLIILAGISIGTLTGDNGLIKQAQTAKTETERSDIEEKINVIVIDNSKEREMNKDKLINDFENKLPDGKEIVDSDNLIYIIYPEYSFDVDIETGDVKQTEIDRVEDETPWELAGSGSEEDPYLIESIEDLIAFSNSVNNGTNYSSKYVKLTTDLDFNLPFSYDNPKTKVSEKTNRIIEEDSNGTELKEFLTSGTGFNPIGNNGKAFSGNFDGNGKEIKNIYINRQENYIGFFGKCNWSEIKGLKISGNVTANGEIEKTRYIGGIVGQSSYRVLIENCYSNMNIYADITNGGYVGGITGDKANNIIGCINKGNIEVINQNSLSRANVSGIGEASEIKNSYNSGNIIAKRGNGTRNYRIAGINADMQNNDIVVNCYNSGNIIIENSKVNDLSAGIVGSVNGSENVIQNCYNIGNVEGYQTYSAGIIAQLVNGKSVSNCCNKGIIGDKGGGIIGYITSNNESVIDSNNNYYQEETASKGIALPGNITINTECLSASKMPSVISVVMTDSEKVEWNGEMVDVWKEDTENINNGYPILFWQ